MNALSTALLVNLIGFTVGVALFALIAAMVLRHRRSRRFENVDRLLMATALLGLLWNLGELYAFVRSDFVPGTISAWLTAISFGALGFLPSLVVHSAQADDEGTHWLTYCSYFLSSVGAALHLFSAGTGASVPSAAALEIQTVGAVALAAGLLLFNFKQTLEKKTIWAAALLVFAVSALHLSGEGEGKTWWVELVAHQASLVLALTILYQNYRFAFADLFLKRAVSLILLALTASGLYTFVAAPMLRYHETHDRDDALAVSLILTLWIATALVYSLLYRLAIWLVDTVLLQRADYSELETAIARAVETIESADGVLDMISKRLASVLTASSSKWKATEARERDAGAVSVSFTPSEARLLIPTVEEPYYEITLAEFQGGRRLLSDEISTLEAIALIAARRIDALRISNERYEQRFREQEFSKLAAEAQLTALRAQINPHFLFNALTTVGYLIEADPAKAYETLLKLTRLLRVMLTTTGEFCTLGEEMSLIENYLDIERARFEEKLTVEVLISDDLRDLRVPSLILQPLVENALKHGISENRAGGTVRISGAVSGSNGDKRLRLTVWDSGAGHDRRDERKPFGVGMRNVEERLASYYGTAASLKFSKSGEDGTTVEIEFGVQNG